MIAEFGLPVVTAYMRHVQDNAAEAVRRVLDRLSDDPEAHRFTQGMDDGSRIAVRVRVDREARRATVDFRGTSAQRADNFNAPAAVTTAAVLYVFRTLVDTDIPLNAGCLEPLGEPRSRPCWRGTAASCARATPSLLNSPYAGGTHLPDITVVTPVFARGGDRRRVRRPLFFVASRGHHADIGGVTPGLDAARQPHHRRGGRADRQLPARRRRPAARGGAGGAAHLRPRIRRATSSRTSPTCAPRSPPTQRGAAELERMVGQFGLDVVTRLHAARPGQCRGGRAPRARPRSATARRHLFTPGSTTAAAIEVARHRSTARRAAPPSTSPAPRPQRADNFNAPAGGDDGGRALRLPHAGRRRHPAQRRLPRAARHRHPAGQPARARLPGRRRGRQRGDVSSGHGRAARRARRGRRQPGDDEQLHLRRRPLPVLRDDLRRRRGRARTGTAAAPCTRT